MIRRRANCAQSIRPKKLSDIAAPDALESIEQMRREKPFLHGIRLFEKFKSFVCNENCIEAIRRRLGIYHVPKPCSRLSFLISISLTRHTSRGYSPFLLSTQRTPQGI